MDTALLAIENGGSVLRMDSHEETELHAFTAYGYDPSFPSSNTVLGFNAERLDPWSESYILGNGYRAFNPNLMRFLCPDSLSPFDEGGVNGYSYCAGDPINRLDPSGHTLLGKSYHLAVTKSFNITSTPPSPVHRLRRERLKLQKDLAQLDSAQLKRDTERLLSFSVSNPGKLKKAHEYMQNVQSTERAAATKSWSDKDNFLHYAKAQLSRGQLKHLYNSTPGLEKMHELSSRVEKTKDKISEIQHRINFLNNEISNTRKTSE